MPKKLAILVVHGMGKQKNEHFARKMIAEVNRRIKSRGLDPDDIAWRAGFWANVIQPHEDQLWQALSQGGDLDCARIRKFVINNLGDAVAYQREPGSTPDVYQQIHAAIQGHIVALREMVGDRDVPLIVMGHSLGSFILSNYIWDQQHPNRRTILGNTAFERVKTLAGLFTFGSNIALFSLALPRYVGITFPPSELADPLRSTARWINFYDPQDVLGYPIKPLCPEFQGNRQIEDRAVDVGSILTSWNPLSHEGYWTDNNFTEPVADQIAQVLRVV